MHKEIPRLESERNEFSANEWFIGGGKNGVRGTIYELRFYNSHQDAIQYGTDYAEERVGRNAKLKKIHNPRWKERLKDARLCLGDQFTTSSKAIQERLGIKTK